METKTKNLSWEIKEGGKTINWEIKDRQYYLINQREPLTYVLSSKSTP